MNEAMKRPLHASNSPTPWRSWRVAARPAAWLAGSALALVSLGWLLSRDVAPAPTESASAPSLSPDVLGAHAAAELAREPGIPAVLESRSTPAASPVADAAHKRYFRLIDRDSQRPIVAARGVLLHDDEHPGVFSDATGVFAVDSAPEGDATGWRIEADGYSPLNLLTARGATDDRQPHTVAMARSAALVVALTGGAARDVQGIQVQIRAPESALFGEPVSSSVAQRALSGGGFSSSRDGATREVTSGLRIWRARTDAQGVARFDALPAGVSLVGRVVHVGGFVQRFDTPFELEPGEVRTLEWPCAEESSLVVELQDERGAPLADAVVGLYDVRASGMGCLGGEESAWITAASTAVQRAKTDASGLARFARVPHGDWFVGASAPARAPEHGDDAPCWATRVHLPGPERTTVRLAPPRPVEGSVLDDGGLAIANATVCLRAPETCGLLQCQTDARGRFHFATAPPGELRAFAIDPRSNAMSEGVAVAPDQVELVLRVRRAHGSLRCTGARSVDAKLVVACELRVAGEDLSSFRRLTLEAVDGVFAVNDLAGGRYILLMSSADDDIGVHRVRVEEGAPPQQLAFELVPAAHVVVSNDSTVVRAVAVFVDDLVVQLENLSPGEQRTLSVPPGDLRIELHEAAHVVASQRVTLRSGEHWTLRPE